MRPVVGVGAGGKGWRTERGEVRVWTPAPSLVVVQFKGYGEVAFVAPVIAEIADALAVAPPVTSFFEAQALRKYDSDLRIGLTDFFLQHRESLETLHVLVGSPLVSMGVSIASLALGQMVRPHSDRGRFLAVIDALSPGFSAKAGLTSAA